MMKLYTCALPHEQVIFIRLKQAIYNKFVVNKQKLETINLRNSKMDLGKAYENVLACGPLSLKQNARFCNVKEMT